MAHRRYKSTAIRLDIMNHPKTGHPGWFNLIYTARPKSWAFTKSISSRITTDILSYKTLPYRFKMI